MKILSIRSLCLILALTAANPGTAADLRSQKNSGLSPEDRVTEKPKGAAAPAQQNTEIQLRLPDKQIVSGFCSPKFAEKRLCTLTLRWPKESKWRLLQVDALMPEHKHGMNVTPDLPKDQQDGTILVAGVKLHMSGLWLLRFELVDDKGKKQWIEQPLTLP